MGIHAFSVVEVPLLLFLAAGSIRPQAPSNPGANICDTRDIIASVPMIPVSTASASYQVHVGSGLLASLGRRTRSLTAHRSPRIFVVTSPEIWRLWSTQFLAAFSDGPEPLPLFLPAGESHKRLGAIERLANQLAQARADRDTLLIAFGGGIVGDVTGFLAAIYMRGLEFIQVPTTLLAQVDSSVGGKTGVNLLAGKNLIGSFHHPLAVIADVDILHTLPTRELRAGLQESVKAGIIRSPKLFAYLEANANIILSPEAVGHTRALTQVITSSVRMKAEVVAEDEREHGLRMILNFGHTLGHAIEAATGYKQLLHGEAIGWGMIAATRLATSRGLLSPRDAARVETLIHAFGPLPAFSTSARKLVALTATDKKTRSGVLSFILPTRIGSVTAVRDVTSAELLTVAASILADANKDGDRRRRGSV